MNPPVDAPTSRQTAPLTSMSNPVSACASLSPPLETNFFTGLITTFAAISTCIPGVGDLRSPGNSTLPAITNAPASLTSKASP